MNNIKILNDKELQKVEGGINPWLIAAGLYIAQDAWQNADQIIQGFTDGLTGKKRRY